jgi:hypothetical protein
MPGGDCAWFIANQNRAIAWFNFKAFWEVCPVIFGDGASNAQWEIGLFGIPGRRKDP